MSNKEKFIRLVEVLERDKASALRVSDSLPFFQDGDEHFNYKVVRIIQEYLRLIDLGKL